MLLGAGPKLVARYARERAEGRTRIRKCPRDDSALVDPGSSFRPPAGRWRPAASIGPRADCREINSPFAPLAPLLRWKIRYLRPLRELLWGRIDAPPSFRL